MSTTTRQAILHAPGAIAPQAGLAAVDGGAPLQEQRVVDSIDFLDLLAAVAERIGIDVPESDMECVAT